MRCLVFVVFGTLVACSSDEFVAPTDGGTEGGPDVVDAGVDAGPSTVLYVDQTKGSDTNDGLAPTRAKKTIVAAANLANVGDPGKYTKIRVCAGTYLESNLELLVPITLEGGFSCDTWTRAPVFGFPTFPATNETIVTAPKDQVDSSGLTTTLRVSAHKDDPTWEISGLRIKGAAGGATPTRALWIGGGNGKLIVHDVQLDGGSPTVTTKAVDVASEAIHLDQSGVEVTHCAADAGTGTHATGFGGIAFEALGGSPFIHENTFRAGKSTGGAGAAIVARLDSLTLGANRGFAKNSLTAADGESTAPSGVSLAEVLLVLKDVTGGVSFNDLRGGSNACSGTAATCYAYGVIIDGSSTFTDPLAFVGNVVHPGTVTGPIPARYRAIALTASVKMPVAIEDNLLFGGHAETAKNADTIVFSTASATTLAVRNNDVYTGNGHPNGGSGQLSAFFLTYAEATSLVGNLVAGPANGGPARAFVIGECIKPLPFVEIAASAFVGISTMLVNSGSTCLAVNSTLLTDLEQNMVSIVGGRDNIQPSLVSTFGSSPTFEQNVVDRKSSLVATATCFLVKGVKSKWASTIDATAKSRTPPTTMGAFELTACTN